MSCTTAGLADQDSVRRAGWRARDDSTSKRFLKLEDPHIPKCRKQIMNPSNCRLEHSQVQAVPKKAHQSKFQLALRRILVQL